MKLIENECWASDVYRIASEIRKEKPSNRSIIKRKIKQLRSLKGLNCTASMVLELETELCVMFKTRKGATK